MTEKWEPLTNAKDVVAAGMAGRVVWRQVAPRRQWYSTPLVTEICYGYIKGNLDQGSRYRALAELREMTTDNKPKCEGCKWFEPANRVWPAGCASRKGFFATPEKARESINDCGPSAKYYEPKDPNDAIFSGCEALAASHARLLDALKAFAGYVASDHSDTSLLDNDALWAKAIEAIAAAQQFAET
jgi:hypothetical protein